MSQPGITDRRILQPEMGEAAAIRQPAEARVGQARGHQAQTPKLRQRLHARQIAIADRRAVQTEVLKLSEPLHSRGLSSWFRPTRTVVCPPRPNLTFSVKKR